MKATVFVQRDLGYCQNVWDARLEHFFHTYGNVSQEEAANGLRDFMLFLSKLCSQNTWHRVFEENVVEDEEKYFQRTKLRNDNVKRPGPLDSHVYLPPKYLVKTFHSVFKKHTEAGQSNATYRERVGDRRGTQQFITNLIDQLEFRGRSSFLGRVARVPAQEQRKQELFYKLIKDAVIATLHSGTTVIETYWIRDGESDQDVINDIDAERNNENVMGGGRRNRNRNRNAQLKPHFSIIARFNGIVGVAGVDNPRTGERKENTEYYRLVFKPDIDWVKARGKERSFPRFTGMWPVKAAVARGAVRGANGAFGAIEHQSFDHDNAFWKTYYENECRAPGQKGKLSKRQRKRLRDKMNKKK